MVNSLLKMVYLIIKEPSYGLYCLFITIKTDRVALRRIPQQYIDNNKCAILLDLYPRQAVQSVYIPKILLIPRRPHIAATYNPQRERTCHDERHTSISRILSVQCRVDLFRIHCLRCICGLLRSDEQPGRGDPRSNRCRTQYRPLDFTLTRRIVRL